MNEELSFEDSLTQIEPFKIFLPKFFGLFYRRLAALHGVSVEQILTDTLLMTAGELSLEALHKKGIEPEDVKRMTEELFGKEDM